MSTENTLVLIKPDGVRRGLIGEVISRFEKAGLKIIAMKFHVPSRDQIEKHYHDLEERAGTEVHRRMVGFLADNPVVAMILSGPGAIKLVRKLVGPTEPLSAPAGTIRGDFCCFSYDHAVLLDMPCKNLIHASSDKVDAEREIRLWFSATEIWSYTSWHNAENYPGQP